MNILVFDTATPMCCLALQTREGCWIRQILAPKTQAEQLLPLIDTLLTEAGLVRTAIDLIGFGQGPGSFMGVRLAASVAQGMALSLDCAVVAIPTLQILAQVGLQETDYDRILAGLDARMDEIYWGCYQRNPQGLAELQGAMQLSAPQNVKVVQEWQTASAAWVAVGHAWHVYAQQIPSNCLGEQALIDSYPKGDAMLKLAQDYHRRGQCLSAEMIQPCYLRGAVSQK